MSRPTNNGTSKKRTDTPHAYEDTEYWWIIRRVPQTLGNTLLFTLDDPVRSLWRMAWGSRITVIGPLFNSDQGLKMLSRRSRSGNLVNTFLIPPRFRRRMFTKDVGGIAIQHPAIGHRVRSNTNISATVLSSWAA